MRSLTVDAGHRHAVVEIFHAERGSVARGLSPCRFQLEPSRYVVQARLPGGEQIQRAVNLERGESPKTVLLGPKERPRLARHGLSRGPRGTTAPEPSLDAMFEVTPNLAFEPACFDLLHRQASGEWQLVGHAPLLPSHHRQESGAAQVHAVRVCPPHGQNVFVPIPGGHLEYFDFTAIALPGGVRPTVRLDDEGANDLLAYLEWGRLDDALLFSEGYAASAERKLGDKRQNPVAAAAGAFALLRLGALDRLHDWTRNLSNWFAWLPDGLVARAEHVARLGDHATATKLLRDLPERGVPALSFGLATATDRLRMYAAAWPRDRDLRAAQEWCTRYALATDFSLPITTYSGQWPDTPEPSSGTGELAHS